MKNKVWSWLVVFVVIALILWLASALTNPEEGAQLDFSSLAWLVFSLLAFVAIYVVYFLTRDSEAWVVGTRQVVMMAIGAALGFLLTPQSGKETRELVKDKASDVSATVKDLTADRRNAYTQTWKKRRGQPKVSETYFE